MFLDTLTCEPTGIHVKTFLNICFLYSVDYTFLPFCEDKAKRYNLKSFFFYILVALIMFMHLVSIRAHQTHYEQFGEISGVVHVDGYPDQQIKVQGVRDHSYGNFSRFNTHLDLLFT